MFQKSQDDEYLRLCIHRAKTITLSWVTQAMGLIATSGGGDLRSLNDIGSNLGQFYRGMKEGGLPFDYHGYEIEPIYNIEVVKIFPELAGRIVERDISDSPPDTADISVTSATLEHIPRWERALDHLLESTRRVLILRTFCGDRFESGLRKKTAAPEPYLIHQFSFLDLLRTMDRHGFDTSVHVDDYTKSLPVYLGDGLLRTQYFIRAIRKA